MSQSITTKLILDAVARRGWQADLIDGALELSSITLPNGDCYYIREVLTYRGSGVTSSISKRKDIFHVIAHAQQFSVPATLRISGSVDGREFLHRYQRIVVKPADQSHGDGVTVDITTERQLNQAVEFAKRYSDIVLAQEQVNGDDYRLLFIGGKLAAAAVREPASVVGNGKSTLHELIEQENLNPMRGDGYENRMTRIDVSAATAYLGQRIEEVPADGQRTQVVGVANIGKGGASVDVTDNLSPELLGEAQRVVDHFRLGICGVDYIVDAHGRHYLIEINTMPSLGLHEYPVRGEARRTPDIFLDWLTSGEAL